jgi:3-hydroxyacyl-CoA dehydrogenase
MNSIGKRVVEGLYHANETVENGPWAGLVIGNGSEHFSVGANLAEMAMAVMQGHWDELEEAVGAFQQMGQRIRYAEKPVVVATQGRVLGGACEMTMACPYPVCAAESYIGLVEIGAGLIPAGGGTMRMAAWAAEQAASPAPEHVAPYLRRAFETVAKAQVATSAQEAQELGFMSRAGTVVMNGERRLWVAKREVLRLAEEGYRAPPVRAAIRVLGTPGRGAFDVGVAHLLQGGYVREHDAFVAGRIAWVITGGDLPAPTWLHEQQLLDLEREVFLSLLGEKATQKQIAELLTRNQPKAAQMAAKGLVSLTNVFRKKRSSARP